METLDLAVLGLAALLTSALTAVAGLGGGIILIAILLLYLEPVVAIPVHAAIQLVSNGSRTWIQRRFIDWGVMARYAALLVPGSVLGLLALSAIPAAAGRVAIGCFVLIATWWPRLLMLGLHPDRVEPRRLFLPVGAVAGFVGTTFGASGPFLGPFFRALPLPRQGVVGTFAACQSLGHLVKIALFGLAGFAFAAHAPLLAVTMTLVVVGTALGSRLLERLPEAGFQRLYRAVLTLVALRLVGAELLRWAQTGAALSP